MFSFHRKIFIGFAFLTIAVGCQTIPISEYSGSSRDLNLIASIKSNAEKYSSDRSVLWIERGYLSKEEANLLQQKIDKAIVEIENFVGIQFDKDAYKKDKIEYFVHSRREASHTITGYRPRKYMFPVIFLTFAAEERAPYVHEAVHIIAWDWNTLWIKEGLAVFLNDKLGGYPAFPNFGADIDDLAESMLNYKYPLKLIGQNGVPKFSNRKERRLFYIFSGSFVKYLHTRIGIETLMEIYKAKNTKKAVAEITGNNLDIWKKDWIGSLKQSTGTRGVTTFNSEKQQVLAPEFKVVTYIPEKVQEGTTILADLHNPDRPKIIEVNMRGELVWEYVIPNHLLNIGKAGRGLDVEALINGNVLFVLPFSGVYEVNRTGEIVWSHTEKTTHDADRLPNGNTIMVMSWDRKDSAQVREVTLDGKVVWEWRAIDHFNKPPYNKISNKGWTHVNAVERLGDGNTLISLRNFGLTVIVDPEGVVIKQYNWDDYGRNPHEPKILPNGNLLVAVRRPHIAFEYNPATGEKIWEFREKGVKTIRGLDRLKNGNTLITGRTEVLEVTQNGEIVWHFHAENISRSKSDKGRWLYKAQRIE